MFIGLLFTVIFPVCSLMLGAGWCYYFFELAEDRKPVLAYATMLDGRPATLMARVYEIRRAWNVAL